MNLFLIYEAAVENAEMHDVSLDFAEYAKGCFNIILSDKYVEIMEECHENWGKSEKGSNNFYHLVEAVLSEIRA